MRFDVELLKKHRFWILLGVAVLFALPAWLVLGTSVSSSIAGKQAAVKTAIKQLQDKKDVKSDEWVSVAREKAKIYKGLEIDVWKEAWDDQAKYFTFPAKFEAKYPFQDGWFARSITAEIKKREKKDESK